MFASETSWRRLQDMSSRRLQDMSSRRLQDMSSRHLQDVFSVTIFRLPRSLGRRKIFTPKTCWRHLQDMSCRPTNVCWDATAPASSWTFVCLCKCWTDILLTKSTNISSFILLWSVAAGLEKQNFANWNVLFNNNKSL